MKLKAFTVIELLTVSVLAAISGTMLYTGAGIINKEVVGIKNQGTRSHTFYTFQHVLLQDTHLAEYIYAEDSETLRFERSYDANNIRYVFGDGMCIRFTQQVADTFQFSTIGFAARFAKEAATTGSPVDLIEVEIEDWDKNYNFTFSKTYGAEMYVNRHPFSQKN